MKRSPAITASRRPRRGRPGRARRRGRGAAAGGRWRGRRSGPPPRTPASARGRGRRRPALVVELGEVGGEGLVVEPAAVEPGAERRSTLGGCSGRWRPRLVSDDGDVRIERYGDLSRRAKWSRRRSTTLSRLRGRFNAAPPFGGRSSSSLSQRRAPHRRHSCSSSPSSSPQTGQIWMVGAVMPLPPLSAEAKGAQPGMPCTGNLLGHRLSLPVATCSGQALSASIPTSDHVY